MRVSISRSMRRWPEISAGLMSTMRRDASTCLGVALVMVSACFAGGCAFGTTRLKMNHGALDAVQNKKQGDILVKQFVDKRSDTAYIGNKRNGFGMRLGHVGMEEGVSLEKVLTDYFAEALRAAGYNAVVQGAQSDAPGQAKFDAVVDGEILQFWMDLYMMVWHNVEVKLRALNSTSNAVVWEKKVTGSESRALWMGLTPEFERVVSEAVTKALNEAAKEFASDEFSKAIKK